MGTIDQINGIRANFSVEIGPTTPISEKDNLILSSAEEVRILYTLLQLHSTLQENRETVIKNNHAIAELLHLTQDK